MHEKLSIKVDSALIERLQQCHVHLRVVMRKQGVHSISRSSVIRAVLLRGVAVLEAELNSEENLHAR